MEKYCGRPKLGCYPDLRVEKKKKTANDLGQDISAATETRTVTPRIQIGELLVVSRRLPWVPSFL